MSEFEGVQKGEICNRDKCKGVIEERDHELNGCTCFDNPPCSYCTENLTYCPECGWDSNEPEDAVISNVQKRPYSMDAEPKKIIEDDGNRYKVRRFFDHHFQAVEGINLKNGDAERLLDKCNNRDRCYISYDKVLISEES